MRKWHKSALFLYFFKKKYTIYLHIPKKCCNFAQFFMNLFKNLLMKKYLYIVYLLAFMLLTPARTMAVGWTPTDAGLVVDLKPNDQILISVMVDHDNNPATPDREYFIGNYTRYTGDDYFKYDAGYFFKLFQQDAHATEPSDMTVWTVDSALTRVDANNYAQGGANKDYSLGGISYTIWNDGRTLRSYLNDRFKIYGDLESNSNSDKLCDVVFVIPTVRAAANFDPNNTFDIGDRNRGTGSPWPTWAFDGKTGTGFLGMTYREVYMLAIPRFNVPVSYTNAALLTFNTKNTNETSWSAGTIKPGRAAYAFADTKHNPTKRTIFRLYVLNDPFVTCPDSYFFAYNQQDYKKYRRGPSKQAPICSWTDSTDAAKIYTQDHLFPMKRVGDTKYYQTAPMQVPVPDSSYYYVGWHDGYRHGIASSDPLGSSTAKSQFTKIRQLEIDGMSGFIAPAGAYGRMIADTTSSVDNLDVKFKPAGYFFRTSSGMNVELKQVDDSTWMAEEMWHIVGEYMKLSGKITLFTGSEFSLGDKGADIAGWTEMVAAPSIPVYGKTGETAENKSGWPRIHTNRTAKNGGIEFVEADSTMYVCYHNNNHFGSDIPDQHPELEKTKVAVQDHRLIQGYEFICWTDVPDTTGLTAGVDFHKYHKGDLVDLSTIPLVDGKRILHLYAQAKYTGVINVAISFMRNGKRYFLTHPGVTAPRYARARHFEDWTEVEQGMADGYNSDPNYLSTYTILGHEGICVECEPGEYVLDPRRDTMRASVDSLVFYEEYAPGTEEYLGLYYTDPNTIVANPTWAGLFKSTEGWPTPARPCVDSTRLVSTHYLTGYPDAITRTERSNHDKPNVVYNAAADQFDGTAGDGTDFMISGIGVVDAHYVIIPDTNVVWRDTIVFENITSPHPREEVTSKLIGKHLLAQMTVGDEIVYLHPSRNETYTTANDLRLSPNYRLTQNFTFIPDARVTSLDEDDRPSMENASGFSCEVVGGHETPMNVRYNGQYIDIVDTLRISLSQGGISKIKAYYDRWKDGAPGLHVNGATRYRDVIVRTKTLHYGALRTQLVLTPEKDRYVFTPLAGNSQTINFTLKKVTSRPLLDVDGNEVSEEVYESEDLTTSLALGPGACSFSIGGIFDKGEVVNEHVVLSTHTQNQSDNLLDTLIISATVRIEGVNYPVTARVPLIQTSLEGDELIWSVMSGKQRYYIMAGTGGLIFRKYKESGSTLYKDGSTTPLVKGSANAANDDAKYITPWKFLYNPSDSNQLALKMEYGVDRYVKIPADDIGTHADIHASDGSYFTYDYVNVYTNANSNEEEQVKLQYGSDAWLKFSLMGGSGAHIELVAEKDSASVFSWSYLNQEYNLTNNGTYPSRDSLIFGYNNAVPASVQTRYKAYKEYTMLVGNKMVNLCRKEETNLDTLTDAGKEWKTTFTVDTIRDKRAFDSIPTPLSRLSRTTTDFTSTIEPSGDSPMGITIGGKYVNIVDTLRVTLSTTREDYRYTSWEGVSSISDACLKIPLVRKTYHTASFDSIACVEVNEEYNHIFPNTITTPVTYTFDIRAKQRTGMQVLDVDNTPMAVTASSEADVTSGLDLSDKDLADVQLLDAFGNVPSWCSITNKTENTITVTCTQSGIRTPRTAYITIACLVEDLKGGRRFVNYRLTVSQPSLFQYANNQHLVHSPGASGDELDEITGMQQVHENKRILYYYPEQDVELPVREKHFFGWWRWFREGGTGIGDTDIPEETWRQKPLNAAGKYDFPFRIIGDSVKVANPEHASDPSKPDSIKQLVTMGRYTVFHYRSKDYPDVRNNPPIKIAKVAPPVTSVGAVADALKPTVTYAVDISNYYDGLPMSVKDKNQVDTARMDTMQAIPEPTLSLREVFELHPWTEMAERMESYKSTRTTNDAAAYPENERYMEDHVMMAPLNVQLLLPTEQRYNYENLAAKGHSESLLGYYMRDDNWSKWSRNQARQDTMIWCGGWDADCEWYTYDRLYHTYTPCTYGITQSDDYLIVPARKNLPSDTIIYCLRARSWKTTFADDDDKDELTEGEKTEEGDYMFNICRYKIVYHSPDKYGPKKESFVNGETKAIISDDEIEQRYEVLETLDFDYNKPGRAYVVYPHPLHWADASYGYTYPETPDLPHNRLHSQTDFPNFGEYGLINRIPEKDHWESKETFWHPMEQHGGAENGYMIYCDGMSSSGQVAALTLETHLCSGQKMFFSGYVGNPSSQKGKANPNFTFEVQGSTDGSTWEDITGYTTGDLAPSNQWYQIYFPIIFNDTKEYTHFRVRIYNMASSWDGNDFIIDDMRIIATKPPLIAYQANTACKEKGEEDTPTHVILRVDYQGITGDGYNNDSAYYTVRCVNKEGVTSFVPMIDHYLREDASHVGVDSKPDTICGKFYIPGKTYEPLGKDSIFVNMNELIHKFDTSSGRFKEGYIYEILEGDIRPVKYMIHHANMDPKDTFTVHMSAQYKELMSSLCGMTSRLKVSNQMVLELNGEEVPDMDHTDLCANTTYDIGLRVKGSLYLDSVAPINLNGTCQCDWLLYGDTAKEASLARYGYYYSDIVKVVKDILRCAPNRTTNSNQFAPSLAAVNRNVMLRIKDEEGVKLTSDKHPYDILADLVNNGFLTLYKPNMTATVHYDDSVKYVIFPILGTGNDALHRENVEVCPLPILIKLKPKGDAARVPLIVGGLHRDPSEMNQPIVVLADASVANHEISVKVDSIMENIGIKSVELISTNDSNFVEGTHSLAFVPNMDYPADEYFLKGDYITFRPASSNNYFMKQGYTYTYGIVMQTILGKDTLDGGCPVGTVPFTLAVVPDYLRWDPQDSTSNQWNKAGNWIGVNANNVAIHDQARFAPLATTKVVIPAMTDGKPYPTLPNLAAPATYDSVQQVGFQYNVCEDIRFLPGAAMNDQERMEYENAVVDMKTPHGKWALRSAPVKGMLSGDMYMAYADMQNASNPWEVAEFDADGRDYTHGNASFWISVYSRETVRKGNGDQVDDTTRTAAADWSKVTNALTLPLPAGQGYAVYTKTSAETTSSDAVVRLPKHDEVYYYFYKSGGRVDDLYENNLQALRTTVAGGSDAGKLAFHAASETYTIENDKASGVAVATTSFIFGNPTMGYIDIWGFISDNSLENEFRYIGTDGNWATTVTKAEAVLTDNVITNPKRYLPPMCAMEVHVYPAASSKTFTLNATRVVTEPVTPDPAAAPKRSVGESLPKGIMTVTAQNPASNRCTSRLLLGQGFHKAILSGEDAILTTVNIDKFSNTSYPATPFNIYAQEGGNGLSVNLLDSIVYVPISFCMTENIISEFEPITHLWFTGVNNVEGPLVLYDALTDTERPIMDGIRITIETPTANHERRYYIRRPGYAPSTGDDTPTGFGSVDVPQEKAVKIIHNGIVYILRSGHIYTVLGQKVR